MLFDKRKLYQNLVKVLIISILGSNSLVVFATDMSGSSEFNEPENISTTDLLSSVCGKINLHTIAAQKYITPQAA